MTVPHPTGPELDQPRRVWMDKERWKKLIKRSVAAKSTDVHPPPSSTVGKIAEIKRQNNAALQQPCNFRGLRPRSTRGFQTPPTRGLRGFQTRRDRIKRLPLSCGHHRGGVRGHAPGGDEGVVRGFQTRPRGYRGFTCGRYLDADPRLTAAMSWLPTSRAT